MPPSSTVQCRLEETDIAQRLLALPDWRRVGESLHRDFRFADFSSAFAWMAKIAVVAETMDHHPEWKNVYNRVEVSLTTHDAGGLTRKDFDLAQRMDRLALEGSR